jgi:hypothetical protein
VKTEVIEARAITKQYTGIIELDDMKAKEK